MKIQEKFRSSVPAALSGAAFNTFLPPSFFEQVSETPSQLLFWRTINLYKKKGAFR